MEKEKDMQLPDLPSQLIKTALEDLEWVEKQPGYLVDMNYLHTRRSVSGKCHVCLAGSVIARRSGISLDENLFPESFGYENELKLQFLDNARRYTWFAPGDFRWLENAPKSEVQIKGVGDVYEYESDPEQFKQRLRKMVKGFEELGL